MSAKLNKKSVFTAVLLLIVVCFVSFGCSYFPDYPKTKTSFSMAIEDNLNISGRTVELLANPDRGYRGEMYITLGREDITYPDTQGNPYDQIPKELSYDNANVKVIQTYVYLVEYCETDLPDTALEQMKNFFIAIRDTGTKILLRFAYEYSDNDDRGPKTKQIVRHCEQLGEWFRTNEKLTYDVVYSVQMGMIGYWGEGHHNKYRHNTKTILTAVANMVPEKINIMVRYPMFFKGASPALQKRLTIHDDFLVGIDHSWGLTVPFDDKDYPKILNMASHQITDGEMPWGRDVTVADIDPILFLKQVVGYGLTTLSIAHNYMEETNHAHFELFKWRFHYLTEAVLIENGFPYNPKMLTNGKITLFEYLNYHLGYQIALSNYSNDNGKVSFVVNNYGFAAPLGYNMELWADGVLLNSISAADMQLYRFEQYKYTFSLPDANKNATLSVRFVSTRDGKTFNLANKLPNQNGYFKIN